MSRTSRTVPHWVKRNIRYPIESHRFYLKAGRDGFLQSSVHSAGNDQPKCIVKYDDMGTGRASKRYWKRQVSKMCRRQALAHKLQRVTPVENIFYDTDSEENKNG